MNAEMSRYRRLWRPLAMVGFIIAAIVGLLLVFGPNGATYEEYERLSVGMSRSEVEDIIGQFDYWHHEQGEYQVVSWVNEDGTYIQTVFDEDDVLVDKAWKIGWNPPGDTKPSLSTE